MTTSRITRVVLLLALLAPGIAHAQDPRATDPANARRLSEYRLEEIENSLINLRSREEELEKGLKHLRTGGEGNTPLVIVPNWRGVQRFAIPVTITTPQKLAEVLAYDVLVGDLTPEQAAAIAAFAAAIPRQLEIELKAVSDKIAELRKEQDRRATAVGRPENALPRFTLTPAKGSKSNVVLAGAVIEGKFLAREQIILEIPSDVRKKHSIPGDLIFNVHAAADGELVAYSPGGAFRMLAEKSLLGAVITEKNAEILPGQLVIRQSEDGSIEVEFGLSYKVPDSDDPVRGYVEKWVAKPVGK